MQESFPRFLSTVLERQRGVGPRAHDPRGHELRAIGNSCDEGSAGRVRLRTLASRSSVLRGVRPRRQLLPLTPTLQRFAWYLAWPLHSAFRVAFHSDPEPQPFEGLRFGRIESSAVGTRPSPPRYPWHTMNISTLSCRDARGL